MSEKYPGKVVIGLTGNIATGKSVVRRMLEHLGAFGIDADGLGHRAMSPGAPAYQPVVSTFGKWILKPDGQIDRAKLASVVFHDPDALRQLESITHPIIRQVIDLLVRRSTQKIVVIEAIKLIEGGLAKQCDTVWVTVAPPEVQLQRLMQGRKMSEADAKLRIESQAPQAEKARYPGAVIIDNSGSFDKTYDQIQKSLEKLMGKPEAGDAAEEQTTIVEQKTATAATAEAPAIPAGQIKIRAGGPKDGDMIATFLNQRVGSSLSRMDIMLRFGQKAYMLALASDQLVALAGWKVENLITRVDEFVLSPGISAEAARAIVDRIEAKSDELQSEIALVFLPNSTDGEVKKAILDKGYEERNIPDLRVPDWREAAEESAPENAFLVARRLREDRVLKPL
ncbi:MAG: dephospho-CoA kinase [Chloroflexi bacterium]|nr:dephospho-CoA kinase [Chloroflexota bacterium]